MYQDPANQRVGGGASGTNLDPVIAIALLVGILLVLFLPRKRVVLPLILIAMLGPFGQQLYVAGFHFYVGRTLIMFGWVRILFARMTSPKEEIASGGFNEIDKIFVLWALFRAAATIIEFMEFSAVTNQVAFLLDALGGYFLFRYLIRDTEDALRTAKAFTIFVIVVSMTMLNEKIRNLNVFGYVGGRLEPFIRDGKIRSQGPFTGPIPAGTFAANLLFLVFWARQVGASLVLTGAGLVGVVVMVITSASSTPLLTSVAAIVAIMFWPLRKSMRAVRWGLVFSLMGLQFVMKAPFWMVINHIDLVGGNSAYHRAMLIDAFVWHFWDWWLIGVRSTASWGWDMWDQANQFAAEGENGGVITFALFILLIVRCFQRLGKARVAVSGDRGKEWAFWCLSSALFTQVVSFFGISFPINPFTAGMR